MRPTKPQPTREQYPDLFKLVDVLRSIAELSDEPPWTILAQTINAHELWRWNKSNLRVVKNSPRADTLRGLLNNQFTWCEYPPEFSKGLVNKCWYPSLSTKKCKVILEILKDEGLIPSADEKLAAWDWRI